MQKYVKGQPLSGQGASGFIAPNNSLMKSLDNLDKIVDETQQKEHNKKLAGQCTCMC